MTGVLILAAGAGTRLRPFTSDTPKPFLPLGDGTIVSKIVGQIREADACPRIFANLHHLPEVAKKSIEMQGLGKLVTTRFEPNLRGPAGSLLTFRDELAAEDLIVVVSGDVVFNGSLAKMIDSHRASGARMTVATAEVFDGHRFGVFRFDADKRVVDLVEKPTWATNVTSTVSAGMYVLHPSLMGEIPPEQEWDFGAHWIPRLLKQERVNLWPIDGSWDDVGSIQTYHRVALEHTTFTPQGQGARFPGVKFAGRNHLSQDVSIGPGSSISDCVFLPGATLPERTLIANAVIGHQ